MPIAEIDRRHEIVPGTRCEIVAVQHPCFESRIGRVVVVTRVFESCVMAHDDKPITYRINRAGNRVVDCDPQRVLIWYGLSELRPVGWAHPRDVFQTKGRSEA